MPAVAPSTSNSIPNQKPSTSKVLPKVRAENVRHRNQQRSEMIDKEELVHSLRLQSPRNPVDDWEGESQINSQPVLLRIMESGMQRWTFSSLPPIWRHRADTGTLDRTRPNHQSECYILFHCTKDTDCDRSLSGPEFQRSNRGQLEAIGDGKHIYLLGLHGSRQKNCNICHSSSQQRGPTCW